jgi:hypothetical protein
MATHYSGIDGTFNAGRNAEKRAARFVERAERAGAIAASQAGDFTVNTAKVKRSRLMVTMLADRRLRQRGVRS